MSQNSNTTTASDQQTCPQFKDSSWPHDAQPRWPYCDVQSPRSQLVFTQESTRSSPTPIPMLLLELANIDRELSKMGYPLRPEIHPTIPVERSLVRYIRPKPRYASISTPPYDFYNGFYPKGKVPRLQFEADLKRLFAANDEISKEIVSYIEENPSFNSESDLDTPLGRYIIFNLISVKQLTLQQGPAPRGPRPVGQVAARAANQVRAGLPRPCLHCDGNDRRPSRGQRHSPARHSLV